MNKPIAEFIRHVDAYFRSASIEALHMRTAADDAQHTFNGKPCPIVREETFTEIMAAQQSQNAERNAITRLGNALAADLETRGFDSTPLLEFMHAVDRDGGPPSAWEHWREALPLLQRIDLGAKPPASAGGDMTRREAATYLRGKLEPFAGSMSTRRGELSLDDEALAKRISRKLGSAPYSTARLDRYASELLDQYAPDHAQS